MDGDRDAFLLGTLDHRPTGLSVDNKRSDERTQRTSDGGDHVFDLLLYWILDLHGIPVDFLVPGIIDGDVDNGCIGLRSDVEMKTKKEKNKKKKKFFFF